MRTNKFLLAGILALGLSVTACTDSVSDDAEKAGNTYLAISLNLASSPLTRALPNDYNYVGTWGGRDVIKTVHVFIVGDGTVTGTELNIREYFNDYALGALTPKKAIKTTAGEKTIYVLINATTPVLDALSTTVPADFATAYQETALALANSGTSTTDVSTSAQKLLVSSDISANEAIVMTNLEPVTQTIQPNVGESDAIGSTSPNRISINVQRALSRVMVTTADDSYTVTNGGTTVGTVSDITWVLAQGEKSLYIQAKSDYQTPAYTYVPSSTSSYWADAAGKYDYSGLFESGTTVPDLSTYVALSSDNKTDVFASLDLDASAVNGKFLLPTTHEEGTGEASKYKKGNTAYVLVRAKFTPAAFADAGTYTAGDDFWLGENGKFYTTEASATDPANGGVTSQKVSKYVGGKVLYYAWVNTDAVPNWYNSPVIRNNIYHIHITGFKTIGTNWNPLYPEDPDAASPTNPDPKPGTNEPQNPIDPTDPLTTTETWMSVDVTVFPWQVHSYSTDLGI